MLTDGDITKRDNVLWEFTLNECKPFIKYKAKNIVFREAILNFLGVDFSKADKKIAKDITDADKQKIIGKYCNGKYIKQCKKQFGDNLWLVCSTCPE